MDEKRRKSNANPYTKAGFFSKLLLCWISPLLKLGYKRPLREDDLYDNAPGEESDQLIDNLEKEWNKELKKNGKNASLFSAITRIYCVKYFFLSMLIFLEETLNIIQPFIISSILEYFEGRISLNHALAYGSFLSLIITVKSIIHHPYFLNTIIFGQRVRIACCGLIYKKIAKLSSFDLETESGGQIINLIANDAHKLETVVLFFPFLILGPLEAIAVLVFLFYKVDVSFLAGLLLLILFIPLQSINGKLTIKFKKLVAKKCDKRLSLLNEVFNGIKIIKMYCWEKPFKIIIENLRKNELKTQKKLFFIASVNSAIDLILPTVFVFISVSFFIFFSTNSLKPSYIVLAMSFYNRLNVALGNHFVKAVTVLLGAKVSLKRIQNFLLKDEIKKANTYKKSNNPYIELENVNASWEQDAKIPLLKDISFEVRNRDLFAIVGPVGSGKTSLLLTILGEIESIKGGLKVSGSVFYVPQEPWIFNGSIRQNITFGKPFDKSKFSQIIKACCLTQDLKTFPRGDKTMLGEKGINLSGGQKARISLARALYSDAQIYLLDDPLSAVDSNVARQLFDDCINGYLDKKIRILVTHHLHYLKRADQIILLENGEIKSKGAYNEIVSCKKNMNLISNIETKRQESFKRSGSFRLSSRTTSMKSNSDMDEVENEKMIGSNQMLDISSNHLSNIGASRDDTFDKEYEELQKYGSMTFKTYLSYFEVGAGVFGAVLNFIVFISSQLIIVYTDYWINYWASIENENFYLKSNNDYSNISQNFNHSGLFNSTHRDSAVYDRLYYYKIYSILTILGVVIGVFRAIYFYGLCIQASKKFHKSMFESLMSTCMRFFDLNPLGRIMNRFSRDISVVDETIPITLFDFMSFLIVVLSGVLIAVAFNYWIIIPLIPLIMVLVYQRKYFLASSMEVKRIDGITRSPIFVHCNSTITGITIIRASRNEEKFFNEFKAHVDYHTRASITFTCINRWFAIRLDWIANIFVYIVVFGCILLKDYLNVNSGQIGMMLVYLCRIIAIFQWCVRQSCEVENLMTSVERILEYVSLEEEPLENGKIKPNKYWPEKGNIRFENVSFSYSKNTPDVLNELDFEIKSGEKVGIVGRTGAGKSSIISTLFRLAEPKGNVYIDDVNIKEISLHDLRKSLSIIPQEPTLFIGTIRSNLDPFNEHSDNELWEALDRVQLKGTVQEMKGGLEAEIQKGGANLSVGQKQLICLARAIIKKSKILIIDEATANVDFATDSLVQKAIRECFSECTVLTIAHRLQTIIDNHKILCLNKGKLENFGTPNDLINDESTILYNLVHSLSKAESRKLIEIAANASQIKSI